MTIGLPLVSRLNPGGAAFANCILAASGMKALAQIGAWHNSLDRMPAVILVSPLLNYFFLKSSDLTRKACVSGFRQESR